MDLWNKKQVREVLKLLKRNRTCRNAIAVVGIDSEGYISITDAYQAHRSKEALIKTEIAQVIEYETLEKWYKLAKAKDMLKTSELAEMMETPKFDYPDVKGFYENEITAIENIGIAQDLLMNYLQIIGDDHVQLKFSGTLKPIYSENKLFKSLIMPVKIESV